VAKALAKAPADRFATATQLGDALTASPALTDVSVKRRRRVGRTAAIALTVVLLVAGGRWAFNAFTTGADRIEWLAVLPPDNLMGDSLQEYFVAGMHHELISKLSQIPGLDVTSRTSAMQYENTDKSVPQIARELNVDAVIESSVLRSGNDVRIQIQLIDAFPRERQLWNDTYDRPIGDILALHSEVALAVAEQIQVTLTPEEAGRLATAGVVDPAAYEDYLMGLYHWNKLTLEGWEAAVGHFQQSTEKDPSYAPAYAMQSFTYSFGLGYYSRTSPAVLHSRALVAAEQAVALDNSLAEAHASLAMVETTFGWDWAAADGASQEALRLNPNSTMALYSRAWFLALVGRHDEAIGIAKRSVELDPVAPLVNTNLGVHYFIARRYDEAIEQLSKVVALEPDYRDAHIWLSYLYSKKGMFEDAARESARVAGYRQSWWPEAWVLAVAGRSAEARELLQQTATEQMGTPIDAYFLAMVLGELGEKDRAFALLEQAYQGRSATMSVLKIEPRIDALRDDPRFEDLLRRMNFPN
jgi:TolB-like protein/Tfp pilus assembly protein PilF